MFPNSACAAVISAWVRPRSEDILAVRGTARHSRGCDIIPAPREPRGCISYKSSLTPTSPPLRPRLREKPSEHRSPIRLPVIKIKGNCPELWNKETSSFSYLWPQSIISVVAVHIRHPLWLIMIRREFTKLISRGWLLQILIIYYLVLWVLIIKVLV